MPSSTTKKPRQRSKENACDKAILETLAYKAIFKYPVSQYQLATYLISNKNFSYKIFNSSLNRLKKSKKIRISKNRYYLPGTKCLSWDKRFKDSKQNLENSEIYIKILEFIPWIKMLGVTGSVAAYNSTPIDDLDIFIVTQKKRLWLTRFFVYAFLNVVGKYPKGIKYAGKICPNIYITEDNMVWDKEKRNIYIATDILLMQPLINRDNTYFKFIKANSWIFDYYKSCMFNFPKKFTKAKAKKSLIVDSLEKIFMRAQIKYMKPKITNEIVSRKIIHFNKNDSTKKILNKYDKQLNKI